MMDVVFSEGHFFTSFQFLIENGVSVNTIKKWILRSSAQRVYFNETPYIRYSTIPAPSLAKLPSESDLRSLLNQQRHDEKQSFFNELLKTASEKEFIKYRDEYEKDQRLSPEQVIYCARLHAIWEKVIKYNQRAKGETEMLFKAFNEAAERKYSTYAVFCTVKTKARKDIKSVVIDTRWFREQHSSIDNQIHYWAQGLLSDPINRTGRSVLRELEKLCKESKLEVPSYSWVKKFVKNNEHNIEVYTHRNGVEKASNIKPYAKIIHAIHAGSQWQIDGWDLPFYYQGQYKGKLTSYLKLVLVAVRDYHSKKIVGYSIGESENTQTILDALQDAVKSTGFLPFEIVSDNHSFNKTSEADYFKEAINTYGVTWTVSSDPKRKAIAERYFRHLGELHCKEFPGYIGQGIKSKEKSGRPSQEYIDQFTKSGTWLAKDEIKSFALMAVNAFNNTPLSKLKDVAPNVAHDQSQKPNVIKVDLIGRIRLFTRKTELKASRGQINLTRSGTTYEYQLNAEQYDKYNGKNVIVRYEDDFSSIHLFDHKDRHIGTVKQKVGIHGALADQTQEDIDLFNKNKGRLEGIKAKARKANEKLTASISPDAFEALNPLTTSKDVIKEISQNYELKQRADELDIDLEMVEVGRKPKSYLPDSLKPKVKKMDSPFSVRGNHKIGLIDLRKESEDD